MIGARQGMGTLQPRDKAVPKKRKIEKTQPRRAEAGSSQALASFLKRPHVNQT
jgi:hypothetical protein